MTEPSKSMNHGNVADDAFSAGDSKEGYRQKLARITLDTMRGLVGLLDASGNVLDLNRAALESLSARLEDVEGKPFGTASWWQGSEDARATVAEAIARAARGETVRWDAEVRVDGKSTLRIEASLRPALVEAGLVVLIAFEGREASEAIAHRDDRRSEDSTRFDELEARFFAEISEELRTPLLSVKASLEGVLAQESKLPAEDRRRLELALRQSSQWLEHVDALLDASRGEAAPFGPKDRASLTSDLASLLRAAIEGANLKLVDGPPHPVLGRVDGELYHEVARNLISDAFGFMGASAGDPAQTGAREWLARLASQLELARVRREAAAANQRSSNILESINEGFLSLDRVWRLTYFNSAAERINQLAREEVLGKDHWKLFPGTVGTKLEREFRRAVADKVAVSFENYFEPRGQWFEIKAYPSAEGGLSVFFRDVTGRKLAEEAVLKSEERYRALVMASTDVVYTMSPDWTEMRRLEGREFIADMHEPSQTWLQQYIHPEDQALVLESINEAIRTKSPFELEHRVLRVDGSLGWTYSRAIPILDASGSIVEWFGTASDVTRRKLAEAERERLAALSERQRRIYEAALSNTPDLVYIFDLDHRFIYANEALLAMWGRSREDANGKTCLELGYEPWHAEMHDREIDQVVATRRPIRGEVPFTGTNGRHIYDYIFVPVVDTAGNVVAVAGSTRDVTERQAAEQEIRAQSERLRENNLRKDEFLAMLAHELRNPLAAISNAVQVGKRSQTPDHREWSQGIIEAQVRNLSRMIDDLLDVSRITRGKIQLRKQGLDLGTVVASAVEAARPFIEARKHRLLVDLAPALRVEGDPTRLEQVVVNLLSNAVKYTESSGRITLVAQDDGPDAVIMIEDNGVGMTQELLGRAFDLFAQGDRTIARSEGGLGIGLTLVKSLVEMHGGSVLAESGGPGRGSRFTLRLPLARDGSSESRGPSGPAPGELAQASRILVVDDNADTALGLARLLKMLGHDVRTAHDGLAALAEARDHRSDFILLDLGLPGMDGYQVARTLRDEGFDQAVIIAISGYGEEQAQIRSRASGFDHHLVKPVDFDSLISLIGSPQRPSR